MQQWRVAALAAATGTPRQPWESDAAYARRLASEASLATRRARAAAAAGVSRWAAHAVAGAAAAAPGGTGGAALDIATVRPLPDAHLEGRICVYVIQSVSVPRMVYIGYSTDADKRLRKHNGELSGGARYTTYGRPWRPLVRIYGFPSKIDALQLERALTYPEHSRHARDLLRLPEVVDLVATRRDPAGLKARIAQLLMFASHFCALPLYPVWYCADALRAHGLAAVVCVYVLRDARGNVRIGHTVDAALCLAQLNGANGTNGANGASWRSLLRVHGFASLDEAREYASALLRPGESAHARPLLQLPVMRGAASAGASHAPVAVTVRLAQLLMCAERFCRAPLAVAWQCEDARDAHEIEFGDAE